MSESWRGLRVAAAVGVVVVVAGEKIANEVFERVLDPFTFGHVTRNLLLISAALVAVGLIAVVACSGLGSALGVPPLVALGVGLAISSRVITVGLDLVVDAAVLANDSFLDSVELFPWINRIEGIALLALFALIVVIGLRMAGVDPRPSAAVAAALVVGRFVVNRINTDRFGLEHRDLANDIRYHLILVAVPVLCALAAVVLTQGPEREPVSP